MKVRIRDVQSVIIWAAFFGFLLFTLFAIERLGIDSYSAVGLGAVLGVLLKMLSDMWQFYFRKAGGKPPANGQ